MTIRCFLNIFLLNNFTMKLLIKKKTSEPFIIEYIKLSITYEFSFHKISR